MRYKCSRCQTEYFEPGECDWCPGVQRTQILETCEERFAKLLTHTRKMEVKAAKWDTLILLAHRMGSKCREVIDIVNQKVRG